MQQAEAFLNPHNAPKSLAAGALPQTPLGELTALPQTPWLDSRGPTSKGRGEEGRAGQGGGEGRAGEWRVCLVLKLPLATPLAITML